MIADGSQGERALGFRKVAVRRSRGGSQPEVGQVAACVNVSHARQLGEACDVIV